MSKSEEKHDDLLSAALFEAGLDDFIVPADDANKFKSVGISSRQNNVLRSEEVKSESDASGSHHEPVSHYVLFNLHFFIWVLYKYSIFFPMTYVGTYYLGTLVRW